jgi:hypothetical protein
LPQSRVQAESSLAGAKSLRISPKRLSGPTTTGISAIIVQSKSEPDVALAAAATIQMPKAINPSEIKYENRVSIFDAIDSRAPMLGFQFGYQSPANRISSSYQPSPFKIGNHPGIGQIARVIGPQRLQIPVQEHRQGDLADGPWPSADAPA